MIDHVFVGAPGLGFPYPDASYFEQYVGPTTITSETDLSTLTILENARIAAGTNPTFTADVQFNGVLYIEQPNVVNFAGNADIKGIIVGDGDLTDNSGTNQIVFNGTISSHSVAGLPESFGDLRYETGTFLMAPGFAVSMGGNFGILRGCIAANGIEFYGNAGGIIIGSILNYSEEPMVLGGNSDISILFPSVIETPPGFDYDPMLQLYSPNGGEEFVSGEEHLIRWFTTGTIDEVLVEYSIDDGLSWSSVNPPNTGNIGSYAWIVPDYESSACLVRVASATDPLLTDTSDLPFTIAPPYTCTEYPPVDFNLDCKVDLNDYAVFVAHWLECNRDPIEACDE
jgi:hypothetical protein